MLISKGVPKPVLLSLNNRSGPSIHSTKPGVPNWFYVILSYSLDLQVADHGRWTCISPRGTSAVDHIWTTPDITTAKLAVTITEQDIGSSDNRMIVLEMNAAMLHPSHDTPPPPQPPPQLRPSWRLSRLKDEAVWSTLADWGKAHLGYYQDSLDAALAPIHTTTGPTMRQKLAQTDETDASSNAIYHARSTGIDTQDGTRGPASLPEFKPQVRALMSERSKERMLRGQQAVGARRSYERKLQIESL
ncbi:hypothetical protein DFS34DRAFT_654325 [Phlyctochytrium arcticum]|nr:hypothetical protein DFS34DRAFT_654325 [Phlyctochytrium arcticum]